MASSRLSYVVISKSPRSSADSRRRNSSKLRLKAEGGPFDGTTVLGAIMFQEANRLLGRLGI